MQNTRRAGFSLIEALVVLAIGGMALAIIFSIGTKAGDTGFALGRRAMSAADSDVSIQDLRNILRSITLRPGPLVNEHLDLPLIGTAQRLEASVIMAQPTSCAPTGWTGRLVLALETGPEGGSLTCRTGGEPITLMRWKDARESYLAYSRDGINWTRDIETPRQSTGFVEAVPSETLWIGVKTDAKTQVVEKISSGLPQRWIRIDELS